MDGSTIATKDESRAVFKKLLGKTTNKMCFECNAYSPKWTDIPFGIFLCYDCAGQHRSYGVHLCFVRSTNLDDWTYLQLAMMQEGGNDNCRRFFRKHGVSGAGSRKYTSRGARMYKEMLSKRAQKHIEENGANLTVGSPEKESPISVISLDLDHLAERVRSTSRGATTPGGSGGGSGNARTSPALSAPQSVKVAPLLVEKDGHEEEPTEERRSATAPPRVGMVRLNRKQRKKKKGLGARRVKEKEVVGDGGPSKARPPLVESVPIQIRKTKQRRRQDREELGYMDDEEEDVPSLEEKEKKEHHLGEERERKDRERTRKVEDWGALDEDWGEEEEKEQKRGKKKKKKGDRVRGWEDEEEDVRWSSEEEEQPKKSKAGKKTKKKEDDEEEEEEGSSSDDGVQEKKGKKKVGGWASDEDVKWSDEEEQPKKKSSRKKEEEEEEEGWSSDGWNETPKEKKNKTPKEKKKSDDAWTSSEGEEEKKVVPKQKEGWKKRERLQKKNRFAEEEEEDRGWKRSEKKEKEEEEDGWDAFTLPSRGSRRARLKRVGKKEEKRREVVVSAEKEESEKPWRSHRSKKTTRGVGERVYREGDERKVDRKEENKEWREEKLQQFAGATSIGSGDYFGQSDDARGARHPQMGWTAQDVGYIASNLAEKASEGLKDGMEKLQGIFAQWSTAAQEEETERW